MRTLTRGMLFVMVAGLVMVSLVGCGSQTDTQKVEDANSSPFFDYAGFGIKAPTYKVVKTNEQWPGAKDDGYSFYNINADKMYDSNAKKTYTIDYDANAQKAAKVYAADAPVD